MSPSGRPNPFKAALKTDKQTSKPAAGNPSAAFGISSPFISPGEAPSRPSRKIGLKRSPLKHPRGISLLLKSNLEELSLKRTLLLSLGVHLATPPILAILALLVMLILHINPFDWLKHDTRPDMTFTMVQDRQDARPEKAKFKGNFNQLAGGAPNKKPPAPVEDQVAPAPKPTPEQAQATPQKPQPKAAPQKPQEQPQDQKPPETAKPIANKPQSVTAIAKPAKTQTQNSPSATALAAAANQALASAVTAGASPANPQAGKGRQPGVDVQQDADMGPYMAELKKRLDRNWKAQGIRASKDQKVELLFYIQRDGTLSVHDRQNILDPLAGEPKVEIKKSSGNGQFDQWAINAVVNSAPYKPLPPDLKYDVVPILFTFDYNVIDP